MPGPDLKARIRLELVTGSGEVAVDEDLAAALQLIEERGSILAAARILGIPYSRLWERLARAARLLGGPLVEARRGGPRGGGARLTPLGREVLARFRRAYEALTGIPFQAPRARGIEGREGLVYAGSNDILLQRILGELHSSGVAVEAYWLGSLGGVASVILGDADVAGLHLLDPDTGEYNWPYVKASSGAAHLALVRGYRRRVGFASRDPITVKEAVEGLISGRLRLANRPRGAGTRVLLEKLLGDALKSRGLPPEPGGLAGRVRGWGFEVKTHLEAAEAVARGDADVALVIEPAARILALHFQPVTWEWFDFLYPTWPPRGPLAEFHGLLCSGRLERLARELPGYQLPPDRCRRIL